LRLFQLALAVTDTDQNQYEDPKAKIEDIAASDIVEQVPILTSQALIHCAVTLV
jgi:hypothetical protein